ncbi:hypothetical protein PR202_ga02104 [Eleusine coracana subsp. coracana]|uniref:Uncharacterized protein n=1 Tax=Eleusine coracana subsp. coracana TaxID=191504 RepID=A0AAV5BGV9_ELECO|nr:hypothetical protein PR202_ga01416 [Eleusine coracana subsp. coracana]GJM86261.1 hypothetical protein PR202_ga02104 [Eleusine coracana subsp. coracana]
MGIVETWVREKPIRTFLARPPVPAPGGGRCRIHRRFLRLGDRGHPAALLHRQLRRLPLLQVRGLPCHEFFSVMAIRKAHHSYTSFSAVIDIVNRILDIATENLQQSFENDFPDNCKEQNTYSKELLEYCCHKALHEVTTRPDYLADKNLRRFDVRYDVGMGIPSSLDDTCLSFLLYCGIQSSTSCNSLETEDEDEGSIFYTNSTRLAIQVSFISRECILAIEGDRPIHPVLQHIGIAAWPGRLVLTTHALYFQSIRVGYGDKIVKYDLATDSNQVIKRDLTGPLGVRLFDKAVMYKSSTLTEPIYFDFPELGGPSRRDYWLAITREVLQVNRFIRKFNLGDVQRAEALSKAILGILRYSAVKEAFHIAPSHFKTTLTFSLAEKLPKGDMVLEALYKNYFQLLDTSLSHLENESTVDKLSQTHSLPFSLYALSRMGLILLKRKDETEKEISFCAACFGVTKSLEVALKESICYSERIESARATVDQVKVEGVDANLALMQELLFPFIEVGKLIYSLSQWEDPLKSLLFLAFMLYTIQRGIVGYVAPFIFLVFAVVMLWHKYIGGGKSLEVLEVKPPPSKNAVEQILTLQEAISKLEDSLQAANIALLKFRAVLFASVPKATEVVAVILIATAAFLVFIPSRHLLLLVVLEVYTREMPLRKQNTEKFRRRIREWWARIPAAPVQMITLNENKKKR